MDFDILKEDNKDEMIFGKIENELSRKKESSNNLLVENNQTQTTNEEKLNAESLKILCSVNISSLDFKNSFELLFNDMAMLKSSAVQGLLSKSNLRVISWMIFLECIPFDKSKWTESLLSNRRMYENIRSDVCCDPRKQSDTTIDHPLSQQKESHWNKFFAQCHVKSIIMQDVIRMYV